MSKETIIIDNAQQEVINCINGPVIVIACPGAGKTTTLLARIHYMVELGVPEENILMVTFTKNAADVMKERYLNKYNEECRVIFKTIHSLCFALLKFKGLYTTSDVLSESEAADFIFYELTHGKTFIEDSYDLIKSILNEISCVKNNYFDIDEYEADCCDEEIFRSIFKSYEQMLKDNHKIDYDNMLIETEMLLRTDKALLQFYQNKFKYIQCDEYQDTNVVQKNILYLLAGDNKNLCVVGDDDQSIYGFRGAEPDVMFDFQKDFPECKTFYINTNYRSGQAIVDISNDLIKNNTKRFDKNFISKRGKEGFLGKYKYSNFDTRVEEMNGLLKEIKNIVSKGTKYKDIAILFRTNILAQTPMEILMNNNIPFRSDEKVVSLYDRWIFKLLCSYLNLSSGKWSQRDLNNILSKPNRYLKLNEFKDCPYDLKEMMLRLDYLKKNKTTIWQAEKAEEEFRNIFSVFTPGRFDSESKAIETIKALELLGLNKAIEERAKKRHEDIEDVRNELTELIIDATKCKTLGEWMDYARKDRENVKRINEERKNIDGVNILTIHSAKGCEWKHVFIIDVNQDIIPHKKSRGSQAAIEEERRLLYVGMTRAKDRLYVMCSGKKSVFIEELMKKKKKKKTNDINIRKPEIGDLYMNKKYGIGLFCQWEGETTMVVKFGKTDRRFNYPEAILEGYLTLFLSK